MFGAIDGFLNRARVMCRKCGFFMLRILRGELKAEGLTKKNRTECGF